MAYYTQVLQPDETVKVVGRLHWSIYLAAARSCWRLQLGVLIVSDDAPDPAWQPGLRLAGGVIGVLGIVLLLGAWIRRQATEIVVTDRRVIFKRGVLTRHTVEMNVSKIETVDVEQSLAGRHLGLRNTDDPRHRRRLRATRGGGFAAQHPQRDRGGLGQSRQFADRGLHWHLTGSELAVAPVLPMTASRQVWRSSSMANSTTSPWNAWRNAP